VPRVLTKTGFVDIPEEQLSKAMASGQWFQVESGSRVRMVNDLGVPVEVNYDPAQVGQMLQSGGRFVSDEEIHQEDLKAKYGAGFGDELAAFGLGAMRAATFGFSDQLAVGAGGERAREALAGYREANPGATIGGEFTGATLPILASGGAAAAPKALGSRGALQTLASAMPTAQLSRASLALEKAMAGGLEKYAARKGLVGFGARALPKVVSGAAEGGAYGLGGAISESALSDHELSAEEILSSVGAGMMLGGGIPLGIEVLKGAGGKLLKPLKTRFAQKAHPMAPEIEAEVSLAREPSLYSKISGTAGGIEPRTIDDFMGSDARAVARRRAAVDGEEMLNKEAKDIATLYTEVEDDLGKVGEHSQEFKPGHVEKQVRVGNEELTWQAAMAANADIEATINKMRQAGSTEFDQAVLSKIEQRRLETRVILDDFKASLEAGQVPEGMNQKLFVRMDQDRRFVGHAVNRVYKVRDPSPAVRSSQIELNDLFNRAYRGVLENEELWGQMAKTQQINNRAWARLLALRDQQVSKNFTRWTKQVGKDEFAGLYKADKDEVVKTLQKLGQDTLEEEHYLDLLTNLEDVTTQHMVNYDLPADAAAAADRALQNIQKIRKGIDRSREISVTRMNFKKISQGKVGGLLGGIGGFAVGGPVGAAFGALAGAVMDPASLIRTRAILDRFRRSGAKTLGGELGRRTAEAFQQLGPQARSIGIAGAAQLTGVGRDLDPETQILQTRQDAADIGLNLAGPMVVAQAVTAVDAAVRQQVAAKVGGLFGKESQTRAPRGSSAYRKAREGTRRAQSLDVAGRQSHATLWKAFRDLMADPEEIAARVERSIAGLHLGGPQGERIAEAVKAKAQAIVQHLLDTAPRPLTPGGLDLMRGEDAQPQVPKDQLIDWFERLRTVEEPLSILDSVKSGLLLPAQADTLRTVYPRIHQEIVAEIGDQAAKSEGYVPFRLEAQLSLLVGAPLSGMLLPQSIAMLQQAAGQQAAQEEAAQQATQPGKKLPESFKLPSMQTAAQAVLGKHAA
jgi:hypothetical protein